LEWIELHVGHYERAEKSSCLFPWLDILFFPFLLDRNIRGGVVSSPDLVPYGEYACIPLAIAIPANFDTSESMQNIT